MRIERRYTVATLVRRLEELGIGRPSTWAEIVGVLRERQYVALANREFVPLERERVATAFLERFFARWVDYGLTAWLEAELDRVAGGEATGDEMLGALWAAFEAALQEIGALEREAVVGAIESALAGIVYGAATTRRGGAARPAGRARSGGGPCGAACSSAAEVGPGAATAARSAAAAGEDGYTGTKPLGAGVGVALHRGPHGWYV